MSFYEVIKTTNNQFETTINPIGFSYYHSLENDSVFSFESEVFLNAHNLMNLLKSQCEGILKVKKISASFEEEKSLVFNALRNFQQRLIKCDDFKGLKELEFNPEFNNLVDLIFSDIKILQSNNCRIFFELSFELNGKAYEVKMTDSLEFEIDKNTTRNNFLKILQSLYSEELYYV